MSKNPEINALVTNVGVLCEFKEPNPEIAASKGICVRCAELALPKCRTELGKREYGISRLCEVCWDEIFAGED